MRYCKSTIFQANHNHILWEHVGMGVVCDTAKVRFFKQITTISNVISCKSCCLRYCKSTIFQANHNAIKANARRIDVVCDTAKVRFFKQITTIAHDSPCLDELFAILQKYDFSSKSQRLRYSRPYLGSCLRYCKSTIFQANHNPKSSYHLKAPLFAILQKYDFSSKSQLRYSQLFFNSCCLRYCKSTIFQANHNHFLLPPLN